jgi:hypothetical protein
MKYSKYGNIIMKRGIKNTLTLTLTIIALLLVGCATAQRGAISRAYSMIENGRYESALKRLSAAESYVETTPDKRAEINFLRARCYEGLNEIDDAIGIYEFIVLNFPDTQYAFRAQRRLKRLNN